MTTFLIVLGVAFLVMGQQQRAALLGALTGHLSANAPANESESLTAGGAGAIEPDLGFAGEDVGGGGGGVGGGGKSSGGGTGTGTSAGVSAPAAPRYQQPTHPQS
jgi:hypothetical protein